MGGKALLELLSSGHGLGVRLREASKDLEGLLCAVAAELLREGRESPGSRQLTAQLAGRGLLGRVREALAEADPGAAAALAGLASGMDRAAERQLRAGSGGLPQLGEAGKAALAEWLRALAGVASLAAQEADVRTRARLALAWGKAALIERLGEGWLEDGEARVRANAVESLWGRGDPEALEIFRRKLADGHQRVEANAAVGLYLAGESEAVAALWSMAQSAEAGRRAAAAWAMGRTGDERFLPLLQAMRRGHPLPVLVARNVVKAQQRIQTVREWPRGEVTVEAKVLAGPGPLRVEVRVRHADGRAVEGLRPVDFCMEVNGAPAWEYRASRVRRERAAELCLAVRCDAGEPPEDRAKELAGSAGLAGLVHACWGYAMHDRGHEEAKVGDILGLAADGAGQEPVAGSLEKWKATAERHARRPSGQAAERRVVAVVERERPAWLAEGLVHAARVFRDAGVRLDLVQEAGAAAEDAMEAARSTGGAVVTARQGEMAEALRRLADSWCDAWRLEAGGVDIQAMQRLRVAVRTGRYRGEALLERG